MFRCVFLRIFGFRLHVAFMSSTFSCHSFIRFQPPSQADYPHRMRDIFTAGHPIHAILGEQVSEVYY